MGQVLQRGDKYMQGWCNLRERRKNNIENEVEEKQEQDKWERGKEQEFRRRKGENAVCNMRML